METTSSKPGLFTFAQRPPPAGNGPWEKNANLLRWTGWLVVASAALSILTYVITVMAVETVAAGAGMGMMGGVFAGMAVGGLIFALAIDVAALWWVSYTYFHWCNRDRRGLGHSLGIGIVLVVLGGIGVLGGMGSFTLMGAGMMMTGTANLLSLATSAGMLVLGILILVNRNKPECQAVFGAAPQTPPPGMAN